MAFAVRMATRAFGTSSVQNAINHVTIIGGGLMGSGIAQVGTTTGAVVPGTIKIQKFENLSYNIREYRPTNRLLLLNIR